MAKSEDGSVLAFFDIDGEPVYSKPGFKMAIYILGEYAPSDADGFWTLVARGWDVCPLHLNAIRLNRDSAPRENAHPPAHRNSHA